MARREHDDAPLGGGRPAGRRRRPHGRPVAHRGPHSRSQQAPARRARLCRSHLRSDRRRGPREQGQHPLPLRQQGRPDRGARRLGGPRRQRRAAQGGCASPTPPTPTASACCCPCTGAPPRASRATGASGTSFRSSSATRSCGRAWPSSTAGTATSTNGPWRPTPTPSSSAGSTRCAPSPWPSATASPSRSPPTRSSTSTPCSTTGRASCASCASAPFGPWGSTPTRPAGCQRPPGLGASPHRRRPLRGRSSRSAAAGPTPGSAAAGRPRRAGCAAPRRGRRGVDGSRDVEGKAGVVEHLRRRSRPG